jgi:hypothetical protein
VASCGEFLANAVGAFFGGLRACNSALGRHDITDESC